MADNSTMSVKSKIEWTDATWNPVRGCSKISPGCKNCYAKTFAERFRGVPDHPFENGFDLQTAPHKLLDPIKWSASKMIFVNSMSDLFHEDIPDAYIRKCFEIMAAANWHTYQVLTKRSSRLRSLMNGPLMEYSQLEHIWFGVSVEDNKYGKPRIQDLKRTNVACRFLSAEPLLEELKSIKLTGIHWVIVGGESGPHSRPMHPDWVRNIKTQCKKEKVPFFFKQWGGTQKHKTGRLLDGKEYSEMPKRLNHPAPDRTFQKNILKKVNREVIVA